MVSARKISSQNWVWPSLTSAQFNQSISFGPNFCEEQGVGSAFMPTKEKKEEEKKKKDYLFIYLYLFTARYDSHGTAAAGVALARNNSACGVGSAFMAEGSGIRLISDYFSDAECASALSYMYVFCFCIFLYYYYYFSWNFRPTFLAQIPCLFLFLFLTIYVAGTRKTTFTPTAGVLQILVCMIVV